MKPCIVCETPIFGCEPLLLHALCVVGDTQRLFWISAMQLCCRGRETVCPVLGLDRSFRSIASPTSRSSRSTEYRCCQSNHQTKPNQKPSIVYTFFAIGSTFHQQVTSVMIIYPEKYQCTQPRHFPKLLHVFKWRYAPTVTPTTADMSPKRRKRNRFLHLRYVRCFPSLPNPCP